MKSFASKIKTFFNPQMIPFALEWEKIRGKGFHYKGQEYVHYSDLPSSEIAFHRLSFDQVLFFTALIVALIECFIWSWHGTLVGIFAVLTALYFIDLLFNFYLIYRSFSKPAEIKITEEELALIQEKNWPSYTVLCPLYREWRVVPQFIRAMSKLEYPKDRLQVMFILEENDKTTLEHVKKYKLPDYFEVVIVPHSRPKTKPKAMNYGLRHSKGDYVVIYDAEDIPDPKQLKKAVIAFAKSDKRTVCIQAKLNYYNPRQNILTRVFTAEYSLWFELVITGLQSINAPIPLGGTSNHFRASNLKKIKGWDAFNVTEDADLGMRLIKKGYRTAIIDSTTLEEANSSAFNWFRQRTRWIKGYMHTYLVHMRNSRDFIKNWREPHWITFQLVVGGKVLSILVNPLMWIITISYFVFRAHLGTFIESFFPPAILYMGLFSCIFGNFLYILYYMIGCEKLGHDDLIKYVFLVPLYWLGISLAGYVSLVELTFKPHYWFKTKHGLHIQS